MMEDLEYVALRIISEQEMIIGPVAWTEAMKVVGLDVSPSIGAVKINSNTPHQVIDDLVTLYAEFFGTSVTEKYHDILDQESSRKKGSERVLLHTNNMDSAKSQR